MNSEVKRCDNKSVKRVSGLKNNEKKGVKLKDEDLPPKTDNKVQRG
jgi:hypothetical protein